MITRVWEASWPKSVSKEDLRQSWLPMWSASHQRAGVAVLTAIPTNSRRIPSRTALNIASAGNPNYCLLTNRGSSGECRLNNFLTILRPPCLGDYPQTVLEPNLERVYRYGDQGSS